jgi:molecular chaperone HscB
VGIPSLSSDAFETLGLEPAFDVDLEVLETRHRELSRALHPDRFASAGAGERRQALGRAIEVNAAFRVLKDPVRRAELLLARHGIETGEQDAARASPELLLDIMEKREALSALRQTRDQAALERLVSEVRAREADACRVLGQSFRASFEASTEATIVRALGELRYYRRFLEEAALVEDDIN